jgi:hypothetical protein
MNGILWATITDQGWIKERAIHPTPANHVHVTLLFGVDEDNEMVQKWVGQHITVQVESDNWNDRIQALAVTLPPRVPCRNTHPHITVSMQAGVKPVESNQMLAAEHQQMPINRSVGAVIEFSPFPNPQRAAALAKAFVSVEGKEPRTQP